MKVPQQKGRRRFDLPPDAEKSLVWYGFIKRLPTTIFWLSLAYVVGFLLLNLGLLIAEADPAGRRMWLYYKGKLLFVVALFLLFAGWMSRRLE